jgi:solute:Na+ symporter, SSS family
MQNPILLAFILLYMVVTVAVGWWAGRRVNSTSEYVVAGKRLPMFITACALFATWFGSETVMGASSEFVEHGVPGVIEDPFGAALCLFLVGILIARPLYRLDMLTFSDYFRMRFNKASEVVSAIFMVPSYFSWIAAQLVALALLLQSVSGIEREWGVLICTVLVLGYIYIGGMLSVAITDFMQTIIILVGLLALTIDMVMAVGGWSGLQAAIPADQPDFFRFWPKGDAISWLVWLGAIMTIGLGSIPQQDIFQRVMSAKTERASINASYLSAAMYLTVAAMPLVIALCARHLYPELKAGDPQQTIPEMVLKHSGLGMQVLFFGALLSAILSTASGAMLAPATVIGENLVKKLYHRPLTDRELLRVIRYSLVGVAGITGVMALSRNDIYELVGESSALSLVSLFVPLVAGLYWKRANATGAIASMVLGIAVWLIALWWFPSPEGPAPEHATWSQVLRYVSPMQWGLVASIAGMVVGSWLGPRPPRASQDK